MPPNPDPTPATPATAATTNPPPTVEPEPKPRSRWDIWVEKNGKPKNRKFPRPKPVPTRFQQKGPLTDKGWKKFIKWAAVKAVPKIVHIPPVPKPERKTQPLNKIMKRVSKLSNPKMPRGKYIAQEPDYPYSPKIDFKKPPHKDKGRPIRPICLPTWWAHEELQTDIWRWITFPVSKNALNHRTTRKEKKMAKPARKPPYDHCPIDEREYSPPPRVKMTPKQWKSHLRRLEYLSDASFKVTRRLKTYCKMSKADKKNF